MPVKGNARISLKQATFYEVEISTSLVGLELTISQLYTEFHSSSCLRSSKQGISKYISIYQGLQTNKLYAKMTKNINLICPMTAILNFTICGKTVSFTAWHTAEMDSFPQKCLQVFI